MIKRIIDFAMEQRLVTLALFLVLVIFGVYAYHQIPIEAFPDPDDVHVRVIVLWSGQAAEEVESLVTRPIEQQLNGTPNLTSLRSVSMFGLSVVTLTFEDGTSDNFARAQVLEKMQSVTLPANAQWQLAALSTSTGEIFRYVIDGPREKIYDLRALEDWVIEPQLRQVRGVADVNVFGGGIKQYQVVVNPLRLLQHRVTLAQVFTALQNNNANTGGNVMRMGEQMVVIRGVGLLKGIQDIGSVWVTSQDGHPVYVRDVADVRIGMAPREGMFAWFQRKEDGKIREVDDIIEGIVLMRKGLNALTVAEGIRDKIRYMNKFLMPRGVRIIPTYDRTKLVDQTVHTVLHNLVSGALLILVISLLFTSNLWAAVIIGLVIPPSLLIAFLILYLHGTPANLLSLGAVDFGIMVDAAVVIVEAILVQKVLSRVQVDFRQLCRDTTEHLSRAVFFSKAILIMALIPIFTFQRVEGRIFKPMALTFASAIFGAALLSLTLVPLMSSILLKYGRGAQENAITQFLKRLYGRILESALNAKAFTLGVATALLLASLALGSRLGTEFLPKLDEGNLWIKCTLSLSVSKEQAKQIERTIRNVLESFPEINQIYSQLGRPDDGTDAKTFSNLEIGADLIPREKWTTAKNKEALVAAISRKLHNIPGVDFAFSQYIEDNVNEALSGVQGELAIKLFGDDLRTLQKKGEEIKTALSSVSGAADLEVEQLMGKPNLNIQLNREALARYGVDVQSVLSLIQAGLGGQVVGSLLEGQRLFDISVRLAKSDRNTVDQIARLWIDTPGGQRIPLVELAHIQMEEGASQIGRDQNSRRIAIRCNIRGRDMGGFVAEAQQRVKTKIKLPPGYRVTWEGQFKNQKRATARLLIIVPLSLLGIAALLFWAFEQVRYALLILVNIPFILIGGIALLYFTQTHLSISAMIGFIALAGVSVQMGVILVGQFNAFRAQGLPLREAVLEGAKIRFRPVLMTALMASLGMLPSALSQGIGSEVQRPLATVICGGMLSAVALTLLVLPVIYEWLETYFPAEVVVPQGLLD